MLAHLGGGPHDNRRAAEVPVISGHGDGASQEIIHLNHGAPLPRMRVFRSVGDVVHRGGDDVVLSEVVDGLFHGHILKQRIDRVVHRIPVRRPFVTGSESGVFQPLGLIQSVTDPVPVVLVAGG